MWRNLVYTQISKIWMCELKSHHEYQFLVIVYGNVAERFIAAVLKTVDGSKSSVSSNLTISAK